MNCKGCNQPLGIEEFMISDPKIGGKVEISYICDHCDKEYFTYVKLTDFKTND